MSVPAGTHFYMSGLGFAAGYSLPAQQYPGLYVSGGEVVLADVTASGVTCCVLFGTPGLYVDGGATVHAARCAFTGTVGYSSSGGSGAVVMNGCRLAADACTFIGGGAGGGFFPLGGSGVYLYNGIATFSRCSAIGGNSSVGWGGQGVAVLQNGFARVAGTGADLLKGGLGVGAPGGYAVYVDGTSSSAIIHGPVSLVSATPGGALTTGAVTTGAAALPYLAITGVSAGAGDLVASQPVTATFDGGIPSAPFVVVLDVAPAFSAALAPATVGELLVPVPTVFALEGILDAGGLGQFSIIPALGTPLLIDIPVYLQLGIYDAVAGQVRLSNGLVRFAKS